MKNQEAKKKLIETGIRLIKENGFNTTGIIPILKEAGVPKGSFYYYFSNKNDFGIQVIRQFAQDYFEEVDRFLENKSQSPFERFLNYSADGFKRLAAEDFRCGCLIGNLAQELASQHEVFRCEIEKAFKEWQNKIEICFEQAQKQGEIRSDLTAKALAEYYLITLEGVILRCKVTKTLAPTKYLTEVFFKEVLQGNSAKLVED